MSARSSTSSQYTPPWSWSFFWSFSKTYLGLIKSYPHSCLDRAQYEDGFLLETLPCFLSGGHKRQHDQTLLTTVHSSSKHHKKKLAREGYFLRHFFFKIFIPDQIGIGSGKIKTVWNTIIITCYNIMYQKQRNQVFNFANITKNNYKQALLLINVNIETNTKPGQQLSKAQPLGSTGSGEAEGDQF